MTITIEGLRPALDRVLPAASRRKKDAAALRCVLFETVDGSLRLAATDRHRLAVDEVAIADGAASFRVLVDAAALAALAIDDPVTVAVEGPVLRVGTAELTIVDEEFPDVDRFLATAAHAAAATLDAAALIDAVERADSGDPLLVRFGRGELTIGDVGVAMRHEGPTVALHVDAAYLHDAATAAGPGTVAVEATTDSAPLAVRSTGDAVHVSLVMPVRIATSRR